MNEPNFEGHLDRECELPAVRAELARWKNLYTEAASIINWGTTCASCARLLDRSYDDYCKLEELTAERDAALAKIEELQNDAARSEHTADAACSAREQMRDENAALRKQGDLDRAHLTIAQAKIRDVAALLDHPANYSARLPYADLLALIGVVREVIVGRKAGPEDRNEP